MVNLAPGSYVELVGFGNCQYVEAKRRVYKYALFCMGRVKNNEFTTNTQDGEKYRNLVFSEKYRRRGQPGSICLCGGHLSEERKSQWVLVSSLPALFIWVIL